MTELREMAQDFLTEACSMLPEHAFAVRLWDGTTVSPEGFTPRFTLVLRHPEIMAKFMASSDWRVLGEAYLRDEVDIEGDMEHVYPVAEFLQEKFGTDADEVASGDLDPFASADPQAHTKERDAEAIEYHYDQGNEAFAKILDDTQNYSSACFYADDGDLRQAQLNKMERVCRKIGLRDGDRILDIGCGWGAVLSYVSERYRATINGVTISKAQAEFCRARLAKEGVEGRASVEICDYRDIDEAAPYDKIISLGMVEHVGVKNLPVYFAKAFKLLRPGGLFALQGVSSSVSEATTEAIEFTNSYLFPDADMPYLAQYIQAASEAGFEVRDVENLREHYAWTHRAWRRNLEANEEAVVAAIGRERYRALRVLYSYSTHYFLKIKCSVYQFVLWKPDGDRPADLPLRREL
ncbi:MAG: class I SAM-dependent methyltransferase [Myxococcales bacterium]|nr:class I SAM-dependent methyltransferase [Myxococcales bacterium]